MKKTEETLYKRVVIRVVPPAGTKDERFAVMAAPRKGFTAAHVHEILDQVASDLEKKNPTLEFRLVELAPNKFNFIYDGLRSEAVAKAS